MPIDFVEAVLCDERHQLLEDIKIALEGHEWRGFGGACALRNGLVQTIATKFESCEKFDP